MTLRRIIRDGQVQTITLGDVDPTVAHQVQVQFTNDAWDGQVPNTDRA